MHTDEQLLRNQGQNPRKEQEEEIARSFAEISKGLPKSTGAPLKGYLPRGGLSSISRTPGVSKPPSVVMPSITEKFPGASQVPSANRANGRKRRRSLSEFTKKELDIALDVVSASRHTQEWAKSMLEFIGVDLTTEQGMAKFDHACRMYAKKILY